MLKAKHAVRATAKEQVQSLRFVARWKNRLELQKTLDQGFAQEFEKEKGNQLRWKSHWKSVLEKLVEKPMQLM